VGADEQTVEAGEAVVAPAGVEHGLENDSSAPLVALVVVTPPPAHV
jgi:quercetin dioxygenase-like cupin family protein